MRARSRAPESVGFLPIHVAADHKPCEVNLAFLLDLARRLWKFWREVAERMPSSTSSAPSRLLLSPVALSLLIPARTQKYLRSWSKLLKGAQKAIKAIIFHNLWVQVVPSDLSVEDQHSSGQGRGKGRFSYAPGA